MKGRHIIVGITGGIAAYKAAMLVRLYVKAGAEVQVLMTETAKKFITPLTMATLSGRPVLTEFFNPENGEWNSHVSLGLWADCMVIAPATANTLSKMASGIADNLLLTTWLSLRCPVLVAPAMDMDMYAHPAVQESLSKLKGMGVRFVEPETGELASGLSGKGRMAEPEKIAEQTERLLGEGYGELKSKLCGKRVLITAGPTREALDPVRYLSNRSSGKMGFALAEAFAGAGADVTLVSGPVSLPTPAGVRRVDVVSAEEMYEETVKIYRQGADIAVFCAAVADYRPEKASSQKIKRSGDAMTLNLVPNPDIAAGIGGEKRNGAIHIGFALETENGRENAAEKLKRKNLDMIVLNSLTDAGAGFEKDTNKITIIKADGAVVDGPLELKSEAALRIVAGAAGMMR